MPPLRYRLLLLLLAPLVPPALLYIAHKRGGDRRYLMQRLGFAQPPSACAPIWIHAASVGEVNAIVGLLQMLQTQYPQHLFLITTNTANAATVVKQKLPWVQHCYLPLDFAFSVRRFLQHWQPRCALIVETELWPNLYAQCQRRNIALCIVNGRLSPKTLHAPRWLHPLFRFCLQRITVILARSAGDREAFISLGADAARVEVLGNIKYAPSGKTAMPVTGINRQYLLAASTHTGEETILLNIWRELPKQNMLLVIAPRYPERRDEIVAAVQKAGMTVALRSRGQLPDATTDVYLVDTLGELTSFMPNASLVFMGGSLVPRGGQNVLEAARCGRAIITGPHTFTFRDDIAALVAAQAIVCVSNATELQAKLTTLLQRPDEANRLGDNARRFIESQKNVLQDYVERIRPFVVD